MYCDGDCTGESSCGSAEDGEDALSMEERYLMSDVERSGACDGFDEIGVLLEGYDLQEEPIAQGGSNCPILRSGAEALWLRMRRFGAEQLANVRCCDWVECKQSHLLVMR